MKNTRQEEDKRYSAVSNRWPHVAIGYHVYTSYLFTASDVVSLLIPQTVFAVFCCLSGSLLTTVETPSAMKIFKRLPMMMLWIWLNLLVLCIANQRLPASITEDGINKSWRPLPSGRLSSRQARHALIFSIVLTFGVSYCLGGIRETLFLYVLNWIYNDLEAADEHFVSRNLLNALGITCTGAGAVNVGCGPDNSLANHSWVWLVISAAIIGTTIQAQDLYDQAGDAKRGRHTAPLVCGDGETRWSVALAVVAWSMAVPFFWRIQTFLGCGLPLTLGAVVAVRTLLFRNVAADRTTFKFWALWTLSLYALPFLKVKGW